ncbi:MULTISPECIES: ABC transporter substrate-binding protein [Agrobacterium tumefaciens complex]|jgi:sorbitol/mannitol transport system substrate-binding protein|uniref:Multiple sugar transport system substrate-binding protein/sorbitol/mannitol transport system substrate-binding protein n=1 Tax=Agrobacterium radiobacter TaxID=362 RepID=A0ABD5LP55_AGRRD|nr:MULTISPECIES: sugar ABC transporter substrate-binding protein [Agrobacterium tumefaciens complex]TGE76787.1 sugar ABC transporter substrate-binding protein [Rhizobium sp. SEMIA 439]EPR14024.1 sugar ABC transporter substrate-binding protein [Agrobacterium radiobacter DSM 30147]KAB0456252.1 sugar ABC transporter substrate-binding protein [Agrobacterium tumefaciens]KWT79550.1 sugar ABC transporter substrate-binding protein [Agrobacterium radiobacter]MBB4284086.1 multiple sugar transport system
MSKFIGILSSSVVGAGLLAGLAQAEEINIATVNNGDMIIMQKLSSAWEKETGNKINWIVLEENVLRERVTTDIATNGGQFDIMTIGGYEAPIWGKQGWLAPVDDLGDDYDYADLLDPIKKGLTVDGKLYAVPFYTESSFTLYRKDLFDAAGLKMPDNPTYDQIKDFAAKLTDKSKQQYGICLRGKPGWGENMAFLGTMINTYGGRWFDMDWKPQLTSEPWKKAISDYVALMTSYGPPGAAANGFNENQTLFASGHCAMWIDATSAAGRVYDPKQSQVADKTAFTRAPVEATPNGSSWSWSWNLAIPNSTKKLETAKSFVKWATSKSYVKTVGESEGWVAVPPGTRKSTYELPEYKKAAPFADTVLKAIMSADPSKPTKDPVPYTGVQFVAIPEFQSIGTVVGQQIAAALSGQQTVDAALEGAQKQVERDMTRAGYIK